MALARERDLEAGKMSIRRTSITRNMILEETESTDNECDSAMVRVKDVPAPPLDGQGIEETDYGTMATKAEGKRPGYVRQVTSESLFKDPIWGKKGVDE